MKPIVTAFLLFLFGIGAVSAQMHDHAMPGLTEDGQANPYVISDARGGFYLVYVERKGKQSNVMLQHRDAGKPFGPAVRVNDKPGDGVVRNENPPKVALGPNGEVYVVWANEREKWKGDIRFARSTDGGKTFFPALTVNSGVSGPAVGRAFQSMAVDHRGRIHIVWIDERNKQSSNRGAEIWMATSSDGGLTFSPDHRILTDVCECCRTAIAADRRGRLYVSYRTVPESGPMHRDIVVARSDDDGKTFMNTNASSDRWELNACPIAGASLAIDDKGMITIVWFTEGGGKPGLFYATSSDRGVTFTPRRLLPVEQRIAKHAHVKPLKDGTVLVAWDDVTPTMVRWGVLDVTLGKMKLLGRKEGGSYPIISQSDSNMAITALDSAGKRIFTHVSPD